MAQLTFKVGANTIEAVTSIDKLTAKVQGMTAEIKAGGDSFTRMDSNAEKLAQRLGVDMTKSLEKSVVAYQSLYDYLVKVGAPMADQERALAALGVAQQKFAQASGPSFWQEHKNAIIGAGTAILGFGVMAVKAFEESELAGAQLAAVLKSTGQAAGVTKEEAEKLALSLMRLTGIDDEAIIGAETILLQFTKIGKEVFPEATKAVLDLSVRMGKDLPSAALMVGKALNDPIGGMQALAKATGKFTDAELDSIKSMVEHGQVAKAQGAILDMLKEKFGGAAEGAGKTFAGALNIAKGEAENFMEAIGGEIVPVLQDLMQSFPNLSTAVIGTGSALGSLNISFGEMVIAAAASGKSFIQLASLVGKAGLAGAVAICSWEFGRWIGQLEIGGRTVDSWVEKILKATVYQIQVASAMGETEKAAQRLNSLLTSPVIRKAGEDVESWYTRVLQAVKANTDLVPAVAAASAAVEKSTTTNKFHVLSIGERIAALKKDADAIDGVTGKEKEWQEIQRQIASLQKEAIAQSKEMQKQHYAVSDAMKLVAQKAKEQWEAFKDLVIIVGQYNQSVQAVAQRQDMFKMFQAEAPMLKEMVPFIQNLEAAYKNLGITTQKSLDDTARNAVASFEKIASSVTASEREVDLALAAMMEAEIAAARARGEVLTEEWTKPVEELRAKWSGTSKEVSDVWSKQISTIVTDFSKGVADIIFEGKNFGETMTNIFKEFGKSILRILIESLFSPLKGLFEDLGDWLGGLFSGGGKAGSTGGGGGLGGLLGGVAGLFAGGATLGGGLLGNVFGGGVGGTIGGAAAGGLGAFVGGSFLGSAIGTGGGLSSGIGGALGALGAIPVYGWIALGAAMLAGPLINKLTQRGKEKKLATGEAQALSENVWKNIIPDMQNQAIGFAEGVGEIQKAWDNYVDFLHKNLKDQTVIQRSIDTQRISLTQGMEAAAKMGMERIQGAFDEIGKTGIVTDEVIANLQDIAKGMEIAGTAAQAAAAKFAVLGAQFLQTGEMTDEFADAVTKAGGSIDLLNDATANINMLKGLQADFLGLKDAIDKLLPKQKTWIEEFIETGIITDELASKIATAGGNIADFQKFSNMTKVKNSFTDLSTTFGETGEMTAQLLSLIMQYGDEESLKGLNALIDAANTQGKSVGQMAKDNQDAARIIQAAMTSTSNSIDAAYNKSAQTLSDTLGKMSEDLGKAIKGLQEAMIIMMKDLIDVIAEVPGAAAKAAIDAEALLAAIHPEIKVKYTADLSDLVDLKWTSQPIPPKYTVENVDQPGTGQGKVGTPSYFDLGGQHFAEGGIVTRPMVATVGEAGPEAIIPLNKAGGLGGNIYITVEKVETSDPDKFIDQLVNMAQTNRSGTRRRLKSVLK